MKGSIVNEKRFRVAWKSRHTEASGHGEYMPEEVATVALTEVKSRFGKDIEHWLEPEPEDTPEAVFPKPAGQFSTDNWQSDRNQIIAEKGGSDEDDG